MCLANGYSLANTTVIEAEDGLIVYDKGDTNENPTDGRRKLVYGLVPGEAGWQLKVEKSAKLNAFCME